MRDRFEAWLIGWAEDLWPGHWSWRGRLTATGIFAGAVLLLALLSMWLIYSGLD